MVSKNSVTWRKWLRNFVFRKNHEENSISISYEMVLRKWFHKNSVIGGNGQEILCLEEKHEENSILRTYVSKKS